MTRDPLPYFSFSFPLSLSFPPVSSLSLFTHPHGPWPTTAAGASLHCMHRQGMFREWRNPWQPAGQQPRCGDGPTTVWGKLVATSPRSNTILRPILTTKLGVILLISASSSRRYLLFPKKMSGSLGCISMPSETL